MPDSNATPITTIPFETGNWAVWIGNEGNGLTNEAIEHCHDRVTIPMRGRAESFNASTAAAIVLWEMERNGQEAQAMDNRVYWIWLQNAFGAGSPKPVQLVRRIGSAEKLYQGGTRLWSSFSFVSDKELAALNTYGAEQAAAALEYYLKLGQKVITPDDEDYPVLLKEIYNPPAVLYVQGDLNILSDAVSISIVGTRKASQNGLNAAREIAYGLALKNAVVISGGALGIDSEAHKGALNGRGKTIAILPCGLEYPYLMDNAILRREIVDFGGALVTEYPMHTPVRAARRVSGAQPADLRHGARRAHCGSAKKERCTHHRKACFRAESRGFRIHWRRRESVFRLYRTGRGRCSAHLHCRGCFKPVCFPPQTGAYRTACPHSGKYLPCLRVCPKIASLSDTEKEPEIAEKKPAEPIPAPENNLLQNVSEDAKVVYAALNDTPKHASELELELGISTGKILAALTELELFGLIKTYPGQRFTKA